MRRGLSLAALAVLVVGLLGGRAPSAGAAGSCVAGDTLVTIQNYSFTPSSVTIPNSGTVCWTASGTGAISHTATSDNATTFDSGTLNDRDSYRFTFSTDGSYAYHCTYHSLQMKGTITVGNPPPLPPPPSPPRVVCHVPNVVGRTLTGARHALVAAHCRLGRVTYAFSRVRKKGRVLSQRPKPRARLPARGRVRVVVSKGRRR